MVFKQLRNSLAELKIWFGVGQGWFYDLRYPVILAIALKVYFPNATITHLIGITIGIIILFIIVGKLDLAYIKMYQAVAEKSIGKYNPYFKKLIIKRK